MILVLELVKSILFVRRSETNGERNPVHKFRNDLIFYEETYMYIYMYVCVYFTRFGCLRLLFGTYIKFLISHERIVMGCIAVNFIGAFKNYYILVTGREYILLTTE